MYRHSPKIIKVAVATPSISHFEVPLYRQCDGLPDIDFRVFYFKPTEQQEGRYDSEYQQKIHWGENMLSGYSSLLCASAKHLHTEVDKWAPDVIIVYGYSWPGALSLIILNWLRGTPQIHRGTLNYYKDPRRGIRAHITRPFRKIIFHLFQAHHYGGSYSERVLKESGIAKKALFFVPYSVDTHFFLHKAQDDGVVSSARALRNSLGWGHDTKVVLYIGQHNWFKGPDIAMQVFAKLQAECPETRLLVVGSGRMTAEMKEYASRYFSPGSYHFAGFCPSKETVKYYLASDIVLFTSRYETWGRAINEAMTCQRVCVLNNIFPAAGGLVEDGHNGFVISNRQPDSYVKAIKHYFGLSAERQNKMMKNARRKAESMSYESHVEDLKDSIFFAANCNRKA